LAQTHARRKAEERNKSPKLAKLHHGSVKQGFGDVCLKSRHFKGLYLLEGAGGAQHQGVGVGRADDLQARRQTF
jgi:hypothetical protein